MWGRLLAMIGKEFRQLLRDVPILFVLVWAFTGAVYVAGHAISMETRDYPVVVYDLARGSHARELIARLHKPHFKIVRFAGGDADILRDLDAGKAALAIVIPPDFERQVERGQGRFQIISDGTLSLSATIAGANIAEVAFDYGVEILARDGRLARLAPEGLPQVEARVRAEYNPNFVNAWFASLLEMLNLTTLVAALLTAAAMVREKEHGTLEQLLMSPLRPAELFVAKIVPTVAVVLLFSLASLFGVVHGVFDTPIRGSMLLFYPVSAIYVFAAASLGLAIAMLARNVAQAMLMLILVLFPMMFLSGAFTPPESMSTWMRYASLVSPMRYYLDFGYQVLFKGNGLAQVWPDVVGILVLGGAMFGIAVWRFRRLFR